MITPNGLEMKYLIISIMVLSTNVKYLTIRFVKPIMNVLNSMFVRIMFVKGFIMLLVLIVLCVMSIGDYIVNSTLIRRMSILEGYNVLRTNLINSLEG